MSEQKTSIFHRMLSLVFGGKKKTTEETTDAEQPAKQDGTRETVESIVVAFVLAFLFRAFEAEAFVIPTGSMAPTLLGRHKDVDCPHCGFHFTVGASDEIPTPPGRYEPNYRLETSACPNCRYEVDIYDLPVFKGDRILVTKFTYEFGSPNRWDVVVFKYPEEPKVNYIKRLVGLPNERLRIRRGDIYKTGASGEWEIVRKLDPYKQDDLQILVYDHDHPETVLHAAGWPKRWTSVERSTVGKGIAGWVESPADVGWQASTETTFNVTAADNDKHQWLRYRHIVPTPQDWKSVERSTGESEALAWRDGGAPKPELIMDYCGYNSYTGGRGGELFREAYWCNDLTLSCGVRVSEVTDASEILFEINEGVRRYRCRFLPASGEAKISRVIEFNEGEIEEESLGSASSDIDGAGSYNVKFSNVDDRLCVWVNNALLDFGEQANISIPETANPDPQAMDLMPIGIAAKSANVTVSHLLLKRDIYYRSEIEHFVTSRLESVHEGSLRHHRHDPTKWAEQYNESAQSVEFELAADEFLMLGDNSPRSKDSRLWGNQRQAERRHAVPRSALVGKAFFIYWPHGVPFMNDGKGYPDNADSPLRNVRWRSFSMFYHSRVRDGRIERTGYPSFRVPFYPQVSRMKRIR